MAAAFHAERREDPREMSAQRYEQLAAVFDDLMIRLVGGGATGLVIAPGQPVRALMGEKVQLVPELAPTAAVTDAFARRLVSVEQHKPWEEVDELDLEQALHGSILHDLVLATEGAPDRVRTVRCELRRGPEGLTLECTVQPAFTVGYGRAVDPGRAPTERELLAWLDDFVTRLFDHQPKPKDVIFSPNRGHPMVTLTGGLKAVEDVVVGGGPITERIARAIIAAAANPLVNQEVEANHGSLRRLDLDMAFKTRAGRRCRVNIADSFDVDNDHGPLITMRLLPERPWTLADLPLPRAVLETCLTTRMGLVLICGTTGSGKSTTMGVLIDYLLKARSVNLLTIENPIETMFPAKEYPRSIISQRELGKHTISSHRGLESAVRQTLNIAMVGEIRNARDAMMALELSQSGHLIFATVHAGSVGESVQRVVDMFPADQEKKIREMLASHYRMGMAQILVRGVHGQTELVLEVMKTNPDIQALILKQQTPGHELTMRELLEANPGPGNVSLDGALVKLFKEGRISEDSVMYNSPDAGSLVLRQNKLDVRFSHRWDPTGAQIDRDTSERLVLQMIER